MVAPLGRVRAGRPACPARHAMARALSGQLGEALPDLLDGALGGLDEGLGVLAFLVGRGALGVEVRQLRLTLLDLAAQLLQPGGGLQDLGLDPREGLPRVLELGAGVVRRPLPEAQLALGPADLAGDVGRRFGGVRPGTTTARGPGRGRCGVRGLGTGPPRDRPAGRRSRPLVLVLRTTPPRNRAARRGSRPLLLVLRPGPPGARPARTGSRPLVVVLRPTPPRDRPAGLGSRLPTVVVRPVAGGGAGSAPRPAVVVATGRSAGTGCELAVLPGPVHRHRARDGESVVEGVQVTRVEAAGEQDAAYGALGVGVDDDGLPGGLHQIGRASCRERV